MNWNPTPYPWPDCYRAAACFTVDVDATSPWLWQHRDKIPSGIAALEHRQYGMRQGLARMVAMLDRLNIPGSFFVPGIVAKDNPDLLPSLIERGHEIGLHGFYHEIVSETSDAQFTDALEASIELFVAQTGTRPAGFRSPAWEMTPHMLSELRRHGLWDSSLMGHDLPYQIDGVTELPVRWDNDDAIFFKFLGAGDRPPRSEAEICARWTNEARAQIRDGGLFMLTVHDWISGRAARVELLSDLFEPLCADETVWVTTCGEIARHHQTVGGLEVTSQTVTPINERTGHE
ncbi:polysaccharide deacetylase family protein [Ruegeria sp. HKCCA6707]|uniref:polysaccharide deacetylase family protein n=1 Tax=unclassified Ruegeria TaxID=2625375 RepID=UPI001487C843